MKDLDLEKYANHFNNLESVKQLAKKKHPNYKLPDHAIKSLEIALDMFYELHYGRKREA